MITSPTFAGQRYAVLGLARSGAAVVASLLAGGADVTAWDGDAARRDLYPGAGRGPVAEPVHLDPGLRRGTLALADPLALDLSGYAGVVVSPGVPLNRHPIAGHAASFGVPVIGDIELFAQARAHLPPHKVVGITGTNGKSTTTALIHHILQTAGVPSLMGGNIGLPILGRDPLPAGGVYVLELSSYQLDLTFTLDCDVAVLTNITPDHLDRYDDFEAYAAAKARLFQLQSADHFAVIEGDDDPSSSLFRNLIETRPSSEPNRVWRWPAHSARNQYDLWGSLPNDERYSVQSAWPALQGPHNAENAVAALLATEALDVPKKQIARGLETYPGLPHRMERVEERNGVLFVNDSKATNATAAAPALAAYPAIHWILGGLPKADDLDDCAPHFGHVRAAYTIGEAGPRFASILRAAGKPVTESGTLAEAVRDAAGSALPGEVVMLSPACASFDQFTDYEARGDAFRRAVEML